MISIVVPVYKSEKTLERCVESLLAQTWKKIEIILVDDGSVDGSPAICDAYQKKDERVRVIHKKNGGVSTARNAGLLASVGTYVAFVDSDDFVEPDYCEKMRNALLEQQGEIAICGYFHHYVGACVEKLPEVQEKLLNLYGGGFLNMPWNKLFVRERFVRKEAGLFPEDLDLGEDLLFNLDYLKLCQNVVAVPVPLYHYIQEESGKTLSSQKRENKLALSKRIRKETKEFFEKRAERTTEPCGEAVVREIRSVVDTRFLCECLDDIERLPFDKEMPAAQKRQVVLDFCKDHEVQEACAYGNPGPLDYRILQWCMRKKMVNTIGVLSWIRSLLVKIKRGLG